MSSLPRASGITGMRTVPAALAIAVRPGEHEPPGCQAATGRRSLQGCPSTRFRARRSLHVDRGPGTRARKRIVPSTEVLMCETVNLLEGSVTACGCVNTHVAPRRFLSSGWPISAVLPSADNADVVPELGIAGGSRDDQLRTLLAPNAIATGEDPCRAVVAGVSRAADQRGASVARDRHLPALLGGAAGAGSDELRALLAPDTVGAREHPRRPHVAVVVRPADHGRPAVPGQGHAPPLAAHGAPPLAGHAEDARTRELWALLAPDTVGAREHPGRTDTIVVAPIADQRGLAIPGQRKAALAPSRAGQVSAVLAPDAAGTGVRPGSSYVADQRGVAVAGQRHACAYGRVTCCTRGNKFWPLLAPDAVDANEHPRRTLREAVGGAADQRRVTVA